MKNTSVLTLVGVCSIVWAVWSSLLFHHLETPAKSDEVRYHLPAIESFLVNGPSINISSESTTLKADLLSLVVGLSKDPSQNFASTTSLYHVLTGEIVFLLSDRDAALIVSALLIVPMYLFLAWWLMHLGKEWSAALLGLPFFFSYLILHRTFAFVPDNLGWFLVMLVIYASLEPLSIRAKLVIGTLGLFLLVATRQLHIWMVAPLAASILWNRMNECGYCEKITWTILVSRLRSDFAKKFIYLLLVGLTAILSLYFVLWLWGGGSVSEEIVSLNRGGNPSSIVVILSLFGIHSLFYIGFLLPTINYVLKEEKHWFYLFCSLGFISALVPQTTFDQSKGRWTGIWNIVNAFPVFGERTSILLVVTGSLGAAIAYIWFRALEPFWAWVTSILFLSFLVIHLVPVNAWQRYYDPLILMLLAVCAASLFQREKNTTSTWLLLGLPVLGGVMQVGLTLFKMKSF